MPAPSPRMHGTSHAPGGPDPIPGGGSSLEWEDVGLPVAPTESIAQTLMAFSFNGPRNVANGTLPWRAPTPLRLDLVLVDLGTAPAGGNLTVRLMRNGASIGTLALAPGATSGSFVPTVAAITSGDVFKVDVTSVGVAPNPGADLVVQLYGVWLAP